MAFEVEPESVWVGVFLLPVPEKLVVPSFVLNTSARLRPLTDVETVVNRLCAEIYPDWQIKYHYPTVRRPMFSPLPRSRSLFVEDAPDARTRKLRLRIIHAILPQKDAGRHPGLSRGARGDGSIACRKCAPRPCGAAGELTLRWHRTLAAGSGTKATGRRSLLWKICIPTSRPLQWSSAAFSSSSSPS